MSSYHGWTHRPKAQGGTDPVAFPDEDAAFLLELPIAADPLGQQRLETVSTWESLQIDPDVSVNNRDRISGGDAVRLETSDDGLGARVVFLTALSTLPTNQLQYWVVGCWVHIGSYDSQSIFDTDTTLKNHQLAIKLTTDPPPAAFRRQTSISLFPSADGDYHITEQVEQGYQLTVCGLLDPSEPLHDPVDAEADQGGIVIQAWHNIDWVDDAGTGKGPPAVNGGHIWGFRYTVGLYDQ